MTFSPIFMFKTKSVQLTLRW